MNEDIVGYPLQWPITFPRTAAHERERAKFDTSMATARDEIMRELRLYGASDIVISTNIPLRKDGLPKAQYAIPTDPGVAVYFVDSEGHQKCFPCDRWTRVKDNMQAVRKTIAALRGLDRWGSKHIVDAAFSGFDALPEQVSSGWWNVLNVRRYDEYSEVKSSYNDLVKRWHPDYAHGDRETFMKIQAAWEEFRKEWNAR